MDNKSLWDLESAMQVLAHDTVDSKLWADAVEWLIKNGPPEIRDLLLEASAMATQTSFPELIPSHFDNNGKPVYNVKELAQSLDMKEEEIKTILQQKEAELSVREIFGSDKSGTTH